MTSGIDQILRRNTFLLIIGLTIKSRMKRRQAEMTYLLYSQRPRLGGLSQSACIRIFGAGSAISRAYIVHVQPFRMPYVDTEYFPGALADYDIPVMPRRTPALLGAQIHIIVQRGYE